MNVRAFLGVELDAATRSELVEVCRYIRHEVPAWRGAKWVSSVNLHLTLSFIGDIDSGSLDALAAPLRSAIAECGPFSLPCITLPDPVPSERRARMLWARYADPDSRCEELVRAIDDVLGAFGIAGEEREFVPHVTLARARRPAPFGSVDRSPASRMPNLSVAEVTLFSSMLTRSGPIYEQLDHFRLGPR